MLLLIVYALLLLHVAWHKRRRRGQHSAQGKRKKRPATPNERQASAEQAEETAVESFTAATQQRSFVPRDKEVVRREQEVKRDAIHIFRRLAETKVSTERSEICREAVALFDAIPERVGEAMALVTSAKICFCNGLMECNGLDELQACRDSSLPHAGSLIERVVPIIFCM